MLKQHSTKILLICLVAAVAYIYHQDKQHAALLAGNQQLTEQLDNANALLLESEETIALLEKNSIEGMLEETNKVVVSGWETLLDTVKSELTKAKERFNVEGFTLDELTIDKGDAADSDKSPAPQASDNQQEQQERAIIHGERT
jgi:cbb3-type cytochrome oxidase subunit 3